jgi:hypothetical protein
VDHNDKAKGNINHVLHRNPYATKMKISKCGTYFVPGDGLEGSGGSV